MYIGNQIVNLKTGKLPKKLDDFSDVSIGTDIDDGDILMYDKSTFRWRPQKNEQAPSSLDELSDTNLIDVEDGSFLKYDAEQQKWIPGTSGSTMSVGWSEVTGKPFKTIDENDFKVVDNTLKFNKAIPENISDLTNDSNFLNSGDILCEPVEISGEKTKIADITIKGETTSIYIPNKGEGPSGGSSVKVTTYETTGTHIADIIVDGNKSELYAPNGGGGSEFVEMTKAQYDALPADKLTDGIPRLIIDYAESGGGSGVVSRAYDYSTETADYVVGTYKGKNIYRHYYNVASGMTINQSRTSIKSKVTTEFYDSIAIPVRGYASRETKPYGTDLVIWKDTSNNELYAYAGYATNAEGLTDFWIDYTKVGE